MLITTIVISTFALIFFVTSIIVVATAINRIDKALYHLSISQESDEDKHRRLKVEAENFEILTGEYSYP